MDKSTCYAFHQPYFSTKKKNYSFLAQGRKGSNSKQLKNHLKEVGHFCTVKPKWLDFCPPPNQHIGAWNDGTGLIFLLRNPNMGIDINSFDAEIGLGIQLHNSPLGNTWFPRSVSRNYMISYRLECLSFTNEYRTVSLHTFLNPRVYFIGKQWCNSPMANTMVSEVRKKGTFWVVLKLRLET